MIIFHDSERIQIIIRPTEETHGAPWSSQWSPTVVRDGPTEGRTPNNWCLQTVVLEKTPKSPLDSKEIKPVNLEGDQPWKFIGGTDAEAESPVLVIWCNRPLIGKVPDARKDWGQKEKRVSESEISGWHHQCNGHELRQTLGDGEWQGGLDCCSPWGRKESDIWVTEQQQQQHILASFVVE